MSREKNFFKSIVIFGLGTILPKLSYFVTLPVYTYALSKAEYGTFDLITTISSLFVAISTLEIQQAAFRFLIEKKEKSNVDQRKIVTNTLVFVIPISFLLASSILMFRYEDVLDKIIIISYMYISVIKETILMIARGLGYNKIYSFCAIAESFFNIIFIVLSLLCFKLGLKGLLVSLQLSSFVIIIYAVIRIKIVKMFSIKLFNLKYLVEMLKYSLPIVPNAISLWVIGLSDRFVLTFFLGIEANAIYAVANKIPQICNLALTTFSLSWQESASLTVKDKDVDCYYSGIFDRFLNLLSSFLALLIAATPLLFKIIIQGEYQEAYNQIPILFLAFYFSCISTYFTGIYIALKKTKQEGLSTFFAALINLVVNLALVNKLGIYASSISTLFCYLVLVIYRIFNIKNYQRIYYQKIKIAIIIATLTMMCFFCSLQNEIFNKANIIISCIVILILNMNSLKFIFEKIKNKFV